MYLSIKKILDTGEMNTWPIITPHSPRDTVWCTVDEKTVIGLYFF